MQSLNIENVDVNNSLNLNITLINPGSSTLYFILNFIFLLLIYISIFSLFIFCFASLSNFSISSAVVSYSS